MSASFLTMPTATIRVILGSARRSGTLAWTVYHESASGLIVKRISSLRNPSAMGRITFGSRLTS